jgi:uncharacterized protein YndB with AHSA1/START domain
MRNPYDGRSDYDEKDADGRSSFEEDEKKFGGRYDEAYEPHPLAYKYSEHRDERDGGRDTYEDWEEVDLQHHHHGRH